MKLKMLRNQPGPSSQKKGKSERKKRNLEREQGTQAVRKKQMQQRAASSEEETTSLHVKVVKVTPGQKAKWQPLPKSTRVHLESMMKWLIISVLYENTQNHRETEKHLHVLKKRLLKRFETLRVPVQKMSSLEKVHNILAEQKKKSVALEEDLSHLQEEIDKAVQAAELRDESIQSLQNKVQELKCELAAEEETASELFQREYSGELDLPELSKHSLEAPILQEQILKIQNLDSILKYLNSFINLKNRHLNRQNPEQSVALQCLRKMLVLNCSTKLQMLEYMLMKSFPESLKVYGAVLNINRGNPFKKEVVVDSWPEFKAVITRRQRQAECDDLDYFTNAYAVFYKDLQAYQALLENPETINWEQVFQIQGLQDGLYNASKAVAGSKYLTVTQSTFQMVIHPNPDALPDVKLPLDPAPNLASLDVSHTNLLNETWARGGSEQCRKYLANLICCFPSVCILDESGCPISWSLTDQFATMIHGYTVSKHRRKGYSRLIATILAKKLHSKGFPAQGNVLEDNVASITLLKSMNAEFLPCQFVRLIHTPFRFSATPHL